MTIIRGDYEFDVDLLKTAAYYKNHSLCGCPGCQRYYTQVEARFPALSAFLADFGVDVSRPDETGWAEDGDEIDYHFVSYTVAGTIRKMGKYEIDLKDGGQFLSVVFNRDYIPNEQTFDYFVITVFGIRLPNKDREK